MLWGDPLQELDENVSKICAAVEGFENDVILSLTNQRKEFRQKIQALTLENNALKQEQGRLSATVQSLEDKNRDCCTRSRVAELANETLKREMSALSDAVSGWKQRVQVLEEENGTLTRELAKQIRTSPRVSPRSTAGVPATSPRSTSSKTGTQVSAANVMQAVQKLKQDLALKAQPKSAPAQVGGMDLRSKLGQESPRTPQVQRKGSTDSRGKLEQESPDSPSGSSGKPRQRRGGMDCIEAGTESPEFQSPWTSQASPVQVESLQTPWTQTDAWADIVASWTRYKHVARSRAGQTSSPVR